MRDPHHSMFIRHASAHRNFGSLTRLCIIGQASEHSVVPRQVACPRALQCPDIERIPSRSQYMLGEHHNLIALYLSVRTVIRLILLCIVHISGLRTPSLRRDPRKCTPYSVRCTAPDGRCHSDQHLSRSACLGFITHEFGALAGICVRDISRRLSLSDLTRGVQSRPRMLSCAAHSSADMSCGSIALLVLWRPFLGRSFR